MCLDAEWYDGNDTDRYSAGCESVPACLVAFIQECVVALLHTFLLLNVCSRPLWTSVLARLSPCDMTSYFHIPSLICLPWILSHCI